MLAEELVAIFPGLSDTSWEITSPRAPACNCVAWAAGDSTRRWWPSPDPRDRAVYWPPGAERTETVWAFVAAFATLNYVPCEVEAPELGFEKVALFASGETDPTHAARQLPNGRWTSKLGQLEDVEHELHALEGAEYGRVVQVLKRPITASPTDR